MIKVCLALLLAMPAAAEQKQKLVVCDDVRDPLTLDPHKQFSEKNHTIVQQIYEGLVRFGPNGEIQPTLAVSWKRMDPLRMRFKLRPGVRFHNGEPFDAEAVRFSLQRYQDPATGFPGLGFIQSLETVKIIDPLTIDIVTRIPDGLLLNRLAWHMLVVPPSYVQGGPPELLSERPVGTGPFRFQRWDRGTSIVLEANPDYWEHDVPKLKSLVFRFLPEEQQSSALFNGEVDLLTNLPGTRTLAVKQHPQLQLIKKPIYYTTGACLRTTDGPLADKRVRKALNYALNKSDLVRYDVLGNGEPLGALTFPGEFGHNPSIKPYAYDPAKARRLLKEAGYASGFTLKTFLKVNAERTGRIIASQLKKLGVILDITLVPDALLVEYLGREKWDMIIGDVPDPMLHPFFIQGIFIYSKSPFALTRDKAYDELLEKMSQTLDPNTQEKLCHALDKYVHDEALSLFTYQRIGTYALRRGIRFVPYVSGMPYFFNVTWETL